ncbi:hypothetical protein G9A89_017572 [Geosiphon pyriformis]|nr:hypothetical protein G9A89_017572 [Geosiphon pyriformis]
MLSHRNNTSKNKFKVATTPDATTLEYYQSIYTHCKQRFNIPDGIEVVKKSVYQYIENCINNYLFRNYNISEIRSNLYNNLVHYSQLGTEDLNSETLATYFQELNFNIIKYCEETYPVQFQYSIDFESETETSNKGKQKLKQYSKTTPNTPILPKTTAKHLQTPEQRTTANEENDSEISEEESIDSENEKDKMTAYIAKISEFNEEDIETSPQEWLDQNAARMLRTTPYFLKGTTGEWFENLTTSFNNWTAFKTAFLEQFTNNNTSITLQNCFYNIKQEPSESHAKRYEMAIGEANCTKLVNLAIGETSSAAEEKIDQLTKKVENYFTNQQQQQPQRYQPSQRRNQNNFAPLSNNQSQNCHYYQQNRNNQHYPPPQQSYYQLPPPAYYLPRPQYPTIPTTIHTTLSINNNRISLNNQLVPRNSTQPRSNHYYIQPSYLTIPKEQNFYHTALLEDRATAQQQNPSHNHTTIPPARIAENANLSNIFSFKFKANESPFLLNSAMANEQKAITAIYTEAEAEGKPIHLILDSRSAESIIIYQLIQQLKRNVDQPAQTVIITANGMKKTPVGEIDNFSFTFDGIIIPVKVLVIDTEKPKNYKSLTKDNMSEYLPLVVHLTNALKKRRKTNNCNIHGSWINNISYLKPEPRKQCLYIPLKCKNCHKKLLSIGACISPKKEYENHTCYYCKACHREQWGHLIKRNMLPEECNWIDVAMRERVCDQICQYALLISEKVKGGTPFDVAYNSALNKLYHYPHDAEMIFDLAMALINRATQENVCQIKKSEYIAYTFEITGYNYEDEVEVYHQVATQRLEQMNIKLCKEYIMPCNEQWCLECYAFSISLPSENNENKIEFGELEATEKIETTLIYLIKRIKLKKAHEIDAGYDLRYPDKDTLVLKPKSLTKINHKIALEISPGAIIQITSQSSLASKGINVRRGIIDAGYTGDITVMLQNETDKLFKIEHAEKIAQAIYLPLINISDLQLVSQREQLGKSDRETQGFGSTGRFTVPVNIALNIQNKSHQIFRLPQPITISPFGEHLEIYTCPKPTTTQQIFESNEQVCLEHNISIPNIYIPEGTKKV